MRNKIFDIEKIIVLTESFRKKGKTFVLTNGCFDILHLGHIAYLREAKKLADYLIVALNNDESVGKLKGNNRPFQNEESRLEILAELRCVDYVFLFSDMTEVIESIKPELYAKGGDYTIDTINQNERKLMEDYGGKIKILSGVAGVSTSNIIDRLKNNF